MGEWKEEILRSGLGSRRDILSNLAQTSSITQSSLLSPNLSPEDSLTTTVLNEEHDTNPPSSSIMYDHKIAFGVCLFVKMTTGSLFYAPVLPHSKEIQDMP